MRPQDAKPTAGAAGFAAPRQCLDVPAVGCRGLSGHVSNRLFQLGIIDRGELLPQRADRTDRTQARLRIVPVLGKVLLHQCRQEHTFFVAQRATVDKNLFQWLRFG
jgi:hypothetical protein